MQLLDILNSPWVITQDKLTEIREIYMTHLRGEKIDIRGIEDRLGHPLHSEAKGYDNLDGVAVLPIEGVIAKRMNLFSQISGGVSTQLIERDFTQALNDPAIHSILLLIDSPGGAVDGTQELANVIKSGRGVKPIVALAEGMMASGAYWIGSAADKVYVSGDTTQVGSIGVVATHTDYSGAEEKKGIKVTEITSGKYKRIASEHRPLTGEGQAAIQDMTDHIYSIFVDDVAANRGVTPEKVLNDMADGRLFLGKRAVASGLVDGMTTLPSLVKSLSADRTKKFFGATGSQGDVMAEPNVDPKLAPKIYSEADHATALEAARAEGTAAGFLKGADQERERIRAIESIALPGHEELIAKLKFDGKTSSADAMSQLIAAEQSVNAKKLEKMRADGAPKVPAAGEAPNTTGDDKKDKKEIDTVAVARKAQQYQREEKAKGNLISVTEAVAHVMEADKTAGR